MAQDEHPARLDHVREFYAILGELSDQLGGPRILGECHGRMKWPQRGVYFFFEGGESRSDSGEGSRVVRVGTHAVSAGSRTTLWNRLRQHRGNLKGGGGNHRGSIFRRHTGNALIASGWTGPGRDTWGKGNSAPREIRQVEIDLERQVSETIGAMQILWIAVEDEPGLQSLRSVIERNSIGLLSNLSHLGAPIDPASQSWLGLQSPHSSVSSSGLWNVNHTEDSYDPGFLRLFRELAGTTRA